MQEDVSVTEKRAAVRDLYDKIKMAIDDVQYKQEKIKRKDHEGDDVRAGGHLHIAEMFNSKSNRLLMCEQ